MMRNLIYSGCIEKKKHTNNRWIISVFLCVEPEGVEPSSKLAARVLSTSLVCVCLSAAVWYTTNLTAAYLLKFRACIEACICYLSLYDTSDRTSDGLTSGEAPAAKDLVCAAGSATDYAANA